MYALTLVAATVLGSVSPEAYALALGRITVQSALGEPLRAEIEVPEITTEEAASLKATVAPPDAFRAAGLDYNPAMSGLRVEMQQVSGGKTVLRVSSTRAINDPFVDLILEVTWSSGRIVRDYTMLFDPPSLRPVTPPPSVAVLPPAAPRDITVRPLPPAAPAAAAPSTAPSPSPAVTPARSPAPVPAPRPAATPAPAPRATAPAAAPAATDAKQVTVKVGDTAGRIAANHKPASVSLDQMLLALLQANPDSFINGNVNLVKAGAVLDIPSADQASLIEPSEASRTLIAQSRDFNDFRRKLAEGVAETPVAAATRQATGKVQAKVEDKKPTATAPDKLTLSKGSVQAKSAADKIAKDRAAQEAAARVAELNKNIAELSKLGAATAGGSPATASAAKTPTVAAAAPTASASVAAAPAAASPAATPTVAPTVAVAVKPAQAPPTVAAASAPAAATASAATASAPAAATAASPAPVPVAAPAPPPAPKAPPPPAPEPSVLDQLMENPLIPASAVGLLALLLGLGVYQARRRKSAAQVDSSFLESRLQPDSFFGASGGQHIDTNEGNPTGSSMVYSPSQLDAAGDVDPVAEADVYLAYGRDLQAEEILKEALRINPKRVAIHGKLLEIYAKRRDAKAFELVASDAFSLTRGSGPDWERICEQGQDLDPNNPLYRPGGEPDPTAIAAAATATTAATSQDFAMATATHVLPQQPEADGVDLDLDLDFSLGDATDEPPAPPMDMQATTPLQVEPTVSFDLDAPAPAAPEPTPDVAMDMDFGMATVPFTAIAEPSPQPKASEEAVRLSAPDLTLSENDLSFSAESFDLPIGAPPAPSAPTPPPVVVLDSPAPPSDAGMIEFDLGALSLDLDPAPAKAEKVAPVDDTSGSPVSTGFDDSGADPLATKLALAEEFSAIGDPDGARSLAEEVLAEASGPLRDRAKRFIAELA